MDLAQAIRTNASIREFGASGPPDRLIYDALDLARFAPSGGNRQGWRVVLVRDAEMRRRLAERYVEAATEAGDSARLIRLDSVGHFEVASPESSAWPEVRRAIRSLLGPAPEP